MTAATGSYTGGLHPFSPRTICPSSTTHSACGHSGEKLCASPMIKTHGKKIRVTRGTREKKRPRSHTDSLSPIATMQVGLENNLFTWYVRTKRVGILFQKLNFTYLCSISVLFYLILVYPPRPSCLGLKKKKKKGGRFFFPSRVFLGVSSSP